MDRAAIFTTILRRNALRRANGLPAIDVQAEYTRQVAMASQRDYRAVCDEHAADCEVIRLEVLAELRTKYGEGFGESMGGRWAVGQLTRRRFETFMELTHGARRPATTAAAHPVTYGERATETSD
jgi:hypothetical protein